MNRLNNGLQREAFFGILIALLVSGFLYFCMHEISNAFLDQHLNDTRLWDQKTAEKAASLQHFVTDRDLHLKDVSSIKEWDNTQRSTFAYIYNGHKQIYNSEGNVSSGGVTYRNLRHYPLNFADGKADLYLFYAVTYQYYVLAMILELILCSIVFIALFLYFVRRKINHITRLEQDIRILESGGMEHEITVPGNDELALLARGLDQMRITLRDNMIREENLVHANNELVTRMAHDLRTPLTTLLLYLGFLAEKKYSSDQQHDHYLHVALDKTERIKALSDQLFERFLVTGEEHVNLENPEPFRIIFEDLLSDISENLTSRGFHLEAELDWPEAIVRVSFEYISRIADNILSNILKYADADRPVTLRVAEEDGFSLITFENMISRHDERHESTRIGVLNIRAMMEKMGGSCEIHNDGVLYSITLCFPNATKS